MTNRRGTLTMLVVLYGFCHGVLGCLPPSGSTPAAPKSPSHPAIQLGPRPFYLLDRLGPGPLRDRLDACRARPLRARRFSIGHRGAPLQFPEHTRESYLAAARMGAGAIECDVTFTRDHALVCRHSQCDLATTTNILETPLAERCSPFEPARIEAGSGRLVRPARWRCCTSDLTLDEFRGLRGRMDASDPRAERPEDFLAPAAPFRTSLYETGGTLLSHAESIELFRSLDVEMMPELKRPEVAMPEEGGFSRADYALSLIEEYVAAGVPARDVSAQSFDADDLRLWIRVHPDYGARAIWLDDRPLDAGPPGQEAFARLHREGFRTVAPATRHLLSLDERGEIVATPYARRARAAGLDLVAWTLERSGRIEDGAIEGRERDFYLGPILPALANDGDLYRVIHALRVEAGVRAIFSDWPAAISYYANCFDLD